MAQVSRKKFTKGMKKKLVVLSMVVVALFVLLIYRLYTITSNNGEEYKRQILSQQKYDSTTIPYKRGTIYDTNGSILASSEKVYNVILDSVALAAEEENIEPTFTELRKVLGTDVSKARTYFDKNKENSRYYVISKKQPYEVVEKLTEAMNAEDSHVKGIWF